VGGRALIHEVVRWIPWAVYAALALLHARRWFSAVPAEPTEYRALRVGAVGLHGVLFLATAWLQHRLPFGTMWEALSLATLVLAGSYLLLEHLARSSALAAPFFTLAAFGSGLSAANHEPPRWPVHVQSVLFAAHVTCGVAGLAFLVAASLLAAAWLLQYRELRARRFGRLSQRLPDLATLDRLFLAASIVGTATLFVGGLLGVVWMVSQGRELHTVLPKFSMVLITVLWNLVLQALRRREAFSIRAAAWMGFVGIVPVGVVIWVGAGGY
jgi:ABC-type transport system involved in cytochrome c biogenesis permease subunit